MVAFTSPVWGPAVGIAGLVYAIADYTGVVDYVLNGVQNTAVGMQQQASSINTEFQRGVSQWSSWQPNP